MRKPTREALVAYFDRIRWIQVAILALGCALAAVEGFVLSWRLGAIAFTFVIGAACNLALEALRGRQQSGAKQPADD